MYMNTVQPNKDSEERICHRTTVGQNCRRPAALVHMLNGVGSHKDEPSKGPFR